VWTAASNTAIFLNAQYPNAVLLDGTRQWTGNHNAGNNNLVAVNLQDSALVNNMDGNAQSITNVLLDADDLTSGTVPNARLDSDLQELATNNGENLTNLQVLVISGTTLVSQVTLDPAEFTWDGTTLSIDDDNSGGGASLVPAFTNMNQSTLLLNDLAPADADVLTIDVTASVTTAVWSASSGGGGFSQSTNFIGCGIKLTSANNNMANGNNVINLGTTSFDSGNLATNEVYGIRIPYDGVWALTYGYRMMDKDGHSRHTQTITKSGGAFTWSVINDGTSSWGPNATINANYVSFNGMIWFTATDTDVDSYINFVINPSETDNELDVDICFFTAIYLGPVD